MGRKLKQIKVRDKFCILTNGKETEKNYFDLIKTYHSIYDVDVKFMNDSPLELVRHALRLDGDINQVWCVFDIDNTMAEGNLVPALKLAQENYIHLAFSNKAFEVWLISHFEKCENEMSVADHFKRLNSILKKEFGETVTYNKADKSTLKEQFIPRITDAIANSKIVHQKWIKQHHEQFYGNKGYPIWEWNSCTNVYQLVEALELQDIILLREVCNMLKSKT